MNVSPESLRCFVEAARRLNFRAAARAVVLSPAALGQRIRQLEDELGATLFRRTTRSVVLTSDGQRLLPHAENALYALDQCRDAVRSDPERPVVEVVVGAGYELGLSWLVPMLSLLSERHRHLTTHLYFGADSELVIRVRNLQLDCAVVSTPVVGPRLETVALHEEDYLLVGGGSSVKPGETLTSLLDNYILFDTTDDLPLLRRLGSGTSPIDRSRFRRVVKLGTVAAIRDQVLRGRGLAVLPYSYVAADLEARTLTRLAPDTIPQPSRLSLVFRSEDPRRELLSSLATSLTENPPS